MYISPKVFFGSLWNFLSAFSNVLRVIVMICGLITWFLYEWENLKCDYPCFHKISSERIGDKPYFGIFGRSFVQMDEDTNQDKCLCNLDLINILMGRLVLRDLENLFAKWASFWWHTNGFLFQKISFSEEKENLQLPLCLFRPQAGYGPRAPPHNLTKLYLLWSLMSMDCKNGR